MQETQTEGKKKQEGRFSSELFGWGESLMVVLIFFVVVFTFFVRLIGVDGTSMYPTLEDRSIMLVTGDVLVNGAVLDEPYIAEKINTLEKMGDMVYPQTVPEGSVFVMGDNRNYSTDSRWSQLGMVDERYILGHVLRVVYPLDRFGSVA